MVGEQLVMLLLEAVRTVVDSEAFWGLTGTIVGGLLAFWGQFYLKKIENKQKSYGTLVGIKHQVKQLYVSRFEAWILSDFYEHRNRIRGGKDQLSLDEARRLMYKSENMVSELALCERELKECFVLAVCNFNLKKDELKILEKLVNHPVPKIIGDPKSITSELELETWKTKAVTALQEKVDEIFDQSFSDSIEILRKKM